MAHRRCFVNGSHYYLSRTLQRLWPCKGTVNPVLDFRNFCFTASLCWSKEADSTGERIGGCWHQTELPITPPGGDSPYTKRSLVGGPQLPSRYGSLQRQHTWSSIQTERHLTAVWNWIHSSPLHLLAIKCMMISAMFHRIVVTFRRIDYAWMISVDRHALSYHTNVNDQVFSDVPSAPFWVLGIPGRYEKLALPLKSASLVGETAMFQAGADGMGAMPAWGNQRKTCCYVSLFLGPSFSALKWQRIKCGRRSTESARQSHSCLWV